MEAFDIRTRSGALVHEITKGLDQASHSYDNIVSYVPTNSDGKECLPSTNDFESSWNDFWNRVEEHQPNLMFIFGADAAKFCRKKLDIQGKKYEPIPVRSMSVVFCDHPSYISVYKRKEIGAYIESIRELCIT